METTIQAVVDEIIEVNRRRNGYMRAYNRLGNQIDALCRHVILPLVPAEEGESWAERMKRVVIVAKPLYKAVRGKGEHELCTADLRSAVVPFLDAQAPLISRKKDCEKRMGELAELLPVWEWVSQQRGVGAVMFCQIVGETGDLSGYANPAKVWKRMSCHVWDGKSARKYLDKDKAVACGYVPRRNTVNYNLASSMMRSKSSWCDLYYARKADKGERTNREEWSLKRLDLDAKRYMVKRFYRDLWRHWRTSVGMTVDPSPYEDSIDFQHT